MGHCCWADWELSHFIIQWMWKQCEHWPHTRGQSSPGHLHSAQQASNGIRQIPQESSLAIHFQAATACQRLMRTCSRESPEMVRWFWGCSDSEDGCLISWSDEEFAAIVTGDSTVMLGGIGCCCWAKAAAAEVDCLVLMLFYYFPAAECDGLEAAFKLLIIKTIAFGGTAPLSIKWTQIDKVSLSKLQSRRCEISYKMSMAWRFCFTSWKPFE